MIKRPNITPEVAAALAANGINADDVNDDSANGDTGTPPPAAPATPPANPPADDAPEGDAPAGDTPPPAAANAGELQTQLSQATLDLAVERRMVTELRTERDNALRDLATLRAETATSTAALTSAQGTITACEGALRTACERLCVAVNASAVDLPSLNGAALAARFDALTAELNKKFPTGGAPRSKPNAPPVDTNTQSAASPIVAAAVAATRSQ